MDFTKWPILRTEDNHPTAYIIYDKEFILKYSISGGKINVSKHSKNNEFIKWIKFQN